jgi:hypothetical protein
MTARSRFALSAIPALLVGGAILRWGISGELGGVDSDTAGMIVMLAGLIGAFAAVLLWPTQARDERRT